MISNLPAGSMKSRMLDTVMTQMAKEPGEIRKLETEAAIHRQTSLDTRYGVDERERATAANNANALEVARIKAAVDRSGHKQIAGVDEDNVVVSYDPSGNGSLVRADGKPPKGAVLPLSMVAKDVAVGRTIGQSVAKADSLMEDVKKNMGAFGGWDSAKVDAAGVLGPQFKGWVAKKTYSPEEQQIRTMVGYQAAEILHQLYGAAVTKGEGSRAAEFEYKLSDPPERILWKIQGMKKLIDYKRDALSPQAQALTGGETEAEKEAKRRGF